MTFRVSGSYRITVSPAASATHTLPNPLVAKNDSSDGTSIVSTFPVFGSMWVGSTTEGEVYRVNPGTNAVDGVIVTGAGTRDLVPVGNQLWVAEFDDDTVSSYRMDRR